MSSTPPPPPPEQQLTALYVAAEVALLAGAAKILKSTLTLGPLAALPRLRRLVQSITGQLAAHTGPLIQAMTDQQAARGRQAADKQIARLHVPGGNPGGSSGRVPPPGTGIDLTGGADYFDLSMDHGDRAAQAIRDDLTSELQDVRFRITRLPDDIYKAIAPHGGIAQVLDNNVTPEQAQAAAWRVFTQNGVTGFTDRSGRDWALSSYVEMAVRTASSRAYNASSLARMKAVGINYFTVPPHVHPCPLCAPWEGAILTDGPNPDPAIRTDGTLQEAIAAGLEHPNCRHPIVGWSPLTPRPERREWTGEDQLRYNATQKQRRLEVEVRKAKRAEATALTPEARQEARADVRAGQARIRAHLAQHPSLGRQSRREQPNLRMGSQKLTPWKPPPGPRPPYSDGSAPDWTAAG